MSELLPGPVAGAGEDSESRLVGSARVLAVLAELARHPDGIGLEDMARAVASPKPTIHRALTSLRQAGFAGERIGAPIARPHQILCIGLNHSDHAAETGQAVPDEPILFTKSPNTLAPR
ncbi:helix-turn-helix domain-containing protein [Nonomuraea basaltis]|uniref:helix-turn-helix domain-containing protein n=1 Tax=Nonomuraea basaltis TaxID=2495887 RepID=UPI001F0E1219|nr:helix-turn-helix domain-containing protein [Nonomuraea basaltis]